MPGRALTDGGPRLRALLIEDSPGDAALVSRALRDHPGSPPELTHVPSLAEGLSRLRSEPYDVVLLDLGLPDARGLEGLLAIRNAEPDLPVVILSGRDDVETFDEAIAAGSCAYILKAWVTGLPEGAQLLAWTIRQAVLLGKLEAANSTLSEEARRDPLTGLLNRRGVASELGRLRRDCVRSGLPLVAALIDCDGFKHVNDVHGHAAGDVVLRAVAQTLAGSVRPNDVVGRVGGDEFLAVLPSTDAEHGARVAGRVRATIASSLVPVGGRGLRTSVSVGVTAVAPHEAVLSTILERADHALRVAKRGGKDAVNFSLGAGECRRRVESVLTAVAQPLVRLPERSVAGHELLVRSLRTPSESPEALFESARRADRTVAFDLRCLATCLASSGAFAAGLVHLNVHPQTLIERRAGLVAASIREHLAPERACVELSVRTPCRSTAELFRGVRELRRNGVQVGLDDVGFGASSVEVVVGVEPDWIKLDRRCIEGIGASPARRAALERLLDLLARPGTRVVAEGVESEADLTVVEELGIAYAQGYHLGAPVAALARARR